MKPYRYRDGGGDVLEIGRHPRGQATVRGRLRLIIREVAR